MNLKEINWEDVKIGETVITNGQTRWLIIGIHEGQAWVKRLESGYPRSAWQIFSKKYIDGCFTIEDPWEDITDECRILASGSQVNLFWGGTQVLAEDIIAGLFRVGKGMRVFKRRGVQI